MLLKGVTYKGSFDQSRLLNGKVRMIRVVTVMIMVTVTDLLIHRVVIVAERDDGYGQPR